MYGIFHIRPVSVGLDCPFCPLFIGITGYFDVPNISEMLVLRTFVVKLYENVFLEYFGHMP